MTYLLKTILSPTSILYTVTFGSSSDRAELEKLYRELATEFAATDVTVTDPNTGDTVSIPVTTDNITFKPHAGFYSDNDSVAVDISDYKIKVNINGVASEYSRGDVQLIVNHVNKQVQILPNNATKPVLTLPFENWYTKKKVI